jgi:hypothetical protein
MRRQQDAHLNNPPHPDPDEIEVTDPSHPLFGRRFPVRHISRQPNSPGYAYVSYREFMTLRIPLPATQLAAPCPSERNRTKLTAEAIRDLLSLVERCEARVRPVKCIFPAADWRGIMFGAPSWRGPWPGTRDRPRSPRGRDRLQSGPTGGAARTGAPRSSGVRINAGLRCGQPVPAAPARRDSCQRSGSDSSSRLAGWVLIRSSTSRR